MNKNYQKILDKAFKKLEREFHEAGIPINKITSVKVNNRLTSTLGYCLCPCRQGVTVEGDCNISISPIAFVEDHPEILRDALAHEMCHAVPGTKGHEGKFQEWADVINEKLGTNISARFQYKKYGLSEPLGVKRNKYVITCKECGNKIYKTRACGVTKHSEQYCCAKCHGELEVQQLY